jgi:hypothetical protein
MLSQNHVFVSICNIFSLFSPLHQLIIFLYIQKIELIIDNCCAKWYRLVCVAYDKVYEYCPCLNCHSNHAACLCLVLYKRCMCLKRVDIAMTIQHPTEGPSRSFTIIVHTYIISHVLGTKTMNNSKILLFMKAFAFSHWIWMLLQCCLSVFVIPSRSVVHSLLFETSLSYVFIFERALDGNYLRVLWSETK